MAPPAAQIRVWDPVVRVLHWSLALSVIGAWVTHEVSGGIHEILGYVALAIVGLRLIWGVVGSRHARWSAFIRSPAQSWAYARLVLRGQEARHLGHNPLGGWMIVALLGAVSAASLSGWLFVTDAFWGVPWVEELHARCADALLVLVPLHVAGVIFTSRRQRENLVAAMWHGRKRADDSEITR